MAETDSVRIARGRQIGAAGTTARIVVGALALAGGLVGGEVIVVHGQVRTGFEPMSVAVGLIAFPAVLLAWQWLRARRAPAPLQATGPLSTALNMLVLAALLLTPLYARPLAFTTNAALVFYGGSMLLAALRGYGGCEVLAISNWVLRRDDQVGCLVFGPIDHLERRLRERSPQHPD